MSYQELSWLLSEELALVSAKEGGGTGGSHQIIHSKRNYIPFFL
jgi:hypothetical protein